MWVMLKPEATYLAFDFGTKKIGVAVGQSLTKSASPLSQIKVKDGEPQWQEIARLIKDWRPAGFVVGIPVNIDGTEQWITHKARDFAKTLAEKFSLPVFDADERLSTKEARSELFKAGGYRALSGSDVDSVAAQILLESWLRENYL
jgi:putative holliday junction resolvase